MPTQHPNKIIYNNLLGVVLCGGKGRRMGGTDKGLIDFNGQPLASYAVNALQNCQQVIINANRNQATYGQLFKLPVISDADNHYGGPLAGMLAALQYACSKKLTWVITLPCDAPYICSDYVKILYQAAQKVEENILIAHSDRTQPVFALLHTDMLQPLQQFLQGNERKILCFYQKVGYCKVRFSETQWFSNINTQEQLRNL